MKKNFFIDICLFLFFFSVGGCLSIFLGIDRSDDVRNYHIYNPYALLNNRISIDFMPASKESYFNPLLDVPYYLATKYLNDYPNLVTFLAGFSYALFLFMIYKITKFILKKYNSNLFTFISVVLAAGVYSVISNTGALNHDVFIFDLVLIVLYLLLNNWEKYCPKLIFLGGFISGITLGLKYSSIMFIFSLVITSMIFYKQFKHPAKTLVFYIFGGFVGFMLVNGWWLYKLWTTFGNPMFPYFNWLFNSPYVMQDNIFSGSFQRHVPNEYYKVLLYPFFFKFDYRLQVIEVLGLLNLILFPFVDRKEFQQKFKIDIRLVDFLLFFCCLSFIIWVHTFGVPRYLAPSLGLVGVISVVSLLKLFFIRKKNKKIKHQYIVFLIVMVFFFTQQITYMKKFHVNRIIKYDSLLSVEDMKIPDNAIVLTGVGVGILVPFQNPKVRYIKNTNIYSKEMINKISEYITNNENDKIYLLSEIDAEKYVNFSSEEYSKAIENVHGDREKKKVLKAIDSLKRLKIFGLDYKTIQCSRISVNFLRANQTPFYLCELEKIVAEDDFSDKNARK